MIADQLWEDSKFAVIQMAKRPGLSLTVIFCLALGLGPNLAIFSLINTILIAPINVDEVEQLKTINKFREGFGATRDGAFSYPEYLDLSRQLAGRHEIAGENKTTSLLYVEEEAYDVAVSTVSNNYFDVLRVEAAQGRAFEAQFDFIPGGMPEIVLSYQFWENQFDSNPAVIGTAVNINASLTDYSIVGVMPRDFYGTSNYMLSDIFVPYEMAADVFPQDPDILNLQGRNTNFLYTRIESEEAGNQLQEQLDTFIEAQIEKRSSNEGLSLMIEEPTDILRMLLPSSVATPLSLGILFLVGLILLLASSSVATLILSRASQRRNEIAVRIASGATIFVVIKQLLTEGLILSLIAALLGWIIALWFAEALPGVVSNNLPSLPISLTISELIMDYRVLGYGLLLVVISTFITSLLPAIQVSRGDLMSGLKEDLDQATSQRSTNKLRHFFLVMQFALCTLLLIVGGLSYQSLRKSAELDLGFSYESMLTFTYTPAQIGFLGPQAKEFSYGLTDVIRGTEGVRQVAIASTPPFSVFNLLNNRTITPVRTNGEAGPQVATRIGDIGLNYFDTMEVDVVKGRVFNREDLEKPRRNTLVLNEAMAMELWGDTDAIGRQFLSGDWSLEVVGIVENYYSGSFSDQTPRVYYPIRQDRYDDQMFITIQSNGLNPALIDALKNNIGQYNDRLLLENLQPITAAIDNALAPLRMVSIFCGALGALALLLTLIGVYGVNSYNIGLKRKEIGIKLSLGASPLRLHYLLIKSGLLLVVVGIALGSAFAYMVNPLLGGILINVSPHDVTTFIAVALLILLIAIFALSIPSWRITRTEPMRSLRYT